MRTYLFGPCGVHSREVTLYSFSNNYVIPPNAGTGKDRKELDKSAVVYV